jgi:hypothetical protein
MNGYDAYQIYQAVRLHFVNDSFDYFTYHGKSKTSLATFDTRKDKFSFHKVARMVKEEELPYFFAVNFARGDNKGWISAMLQKESMELFEKWKVWQQNRSENLKQNLVELKKNHKFEDIIGCKNGQFPELLNVLLRNEIDYDTFVILDHYINLTNAWNKKITDDFIWTEFYKKFKKYKPFFLNYAPMSDVFYKKLILENIK